MPRSRASADEPLDAVFPPIEPAEQPHHDHLGVDRDASIHRSTDIGWRRSRRCARRTLGRICSLGLPRGGEPGEVAVGERQHRDVAGRLAEIDRFDNLVEVGAGGRQQMHALTPPARG